MKTKDTRITHDADYNKTQLMLRDEWFLDQLSALRKRFDELGCPIPEKGFSSAKDYFAWRDGYWKLYGEMRRSDEYKRRVEEITGGKERISLEELNQIEDFEHAFLPPQYGEWIGEILKHYGIEKQKKRYFHDFVEFHLFLGFTEFPKSNLLVRRTDDKDGNPELLIKIYGRTKLEDLVKDWKFVVAHQKQLPDYVGKNKEWKMMDRDIEIYQLYKKLKRTTQAKRRGYLKGMDTEIFTKLHSKYTELNVSNIRAIISATKKRLGEK